MLFVLRHLNPNQNVKQVGGTVGLAPFIDGDDAERADVRVSALVVYCDLLFKIQKCMQQWEGEHSTHK